MFRPFPAMLSVAVLAGSTLAAIESPRAPVMAEVVLQSPQFLYRVEFGEAAPDVGAHIARPLQYEMANRLSFLFWGSAPDPTLTSVPGAASRRTSASAIQPSSGDSATVARCPTERPSKLTSSPVVAGPARRSPRRWRFGLPR